MSLVCQIFGHSWTGPEVRHNDITLDEFTELTREWFDRPELVKPIWVEFPRNPVVVRIHRRLCSRCEA